MFGCSRLRGWARSPAGGGDFLDTLKRAVIATLLLVAFQDISQGILLIADGITEKIDNMSGLNSVMQMAAEKSQSYSHSSFSLILQFDDFIIALLSFASYLVLYFARYITVAMYYFFWIFLSISAPLLLLFYLFPATSNITVNLFRSMCEVASWKICWAILSAMLTALSFGDNVADVYSDEGLSAKDTKRPAFQRMMRDIRKGRINLILVTDLSRLSRNILDFCLLLEELKKYNAKFLSLKEQFDTSTPAGEMMVFNMINLAQFERKQTAERVSLTN